MSNEKIGFYICALVDILGQKIKLKGLDDIQCLSTDHVQANKIFNRTYGHTKKLKMAVSKWAGYFNETANKCDSSPEIKFNFFSDLVVVYLSLSSDGKNLDICKLKYVLFCLSGAFLQLLSEKIPLRGGIDIGIAIEGHNNQIYGSALSRAYELESNVAGSIRLVVGQGLVDFLDVACRQQNGKYYNDAVFCRKLIKKDADGIYILDYLSEEFQKLSGFSDLSGSAKLFLEIENNKFRKIGDYKTAQKYQKALDYFDGSVS